jgi:histidinol-phosphate aminotransferase
VPGKPIAEVRRELGLDSIVKLASNENPLGPSPLAAEAAARAIGEAHRYPDPGGFALREALAERHGLSMDGIVLGNGSVEIVEQITEAFLDPGDEAVVGNPAFFKYDIAVRIMGGRVVDVPLREWRGDGRRRHAPDACGIHSQPEQSDRDDGLRGGGGRLPLTPPAGGCHGLRRSVL